MQIDTTATSQAASPQETVGKVGFPRVERVGVSIHARLCPSRLIKRRDLLTSAPQAPSGALALRRRLDRSSTDTG